MKRYIALKHIALAAGGLVSPGEFFTADFPPETEARLVKKGAIEARPLMVPAANTVHDEPDKPEESADCEETNEPDEQGEAPDEDEEEPDAPEIDVSAGVIGAKKNVRSRKK